MMHAISSYIYFPRHSKDNSESESDQPLQTEPISMESVVRISKLPVIESTVQTAAYVYGKVKDYNRLTRWTCSSAENVVSKAVEVAMPIVQGFQGPIKKVDGVICTGLDYVEAKVPTVKLPPAEVLTTTKEYVNQNVTPKAEAAYHYVEPTVKNAYEKMEPAIQAAKTVMEPALEKAKNVVEPFVQPALDLASQLKDYSFDKFEQVFGSSHEHSSSDEGECPDCEAEREIQRDGVESELLNVY